jgi:hypothetical protein
MFIATFSLDQKNERETGPFERPRRTSIPSCISKGTNVSDSFGSEDKQDFQLELRAEDVLDDDSHQFVDKIRSINLRQT